MTAKQIAEVVAKLGFEAEVSLNEDGDEEIVVSEELDGVELHPGAGPTLFVYTPDGVCHELNGHDLDAVGRVLETWA